MALPATHPPKLSPRPENALHSISKGIGTVIGAPSMIIDKFNTGFAQATNSIAAVFPSMPAASMGSLVLGIPHAHMAHPPSLIPPLPPIPFPPFGPIMAGVCIQVLINSRPAARCGDIIFSPTCMAIPPTGMGLIKTGSSNVFIGGSRAARQFMDVTWHCKMEFGVKSGKLTKMQKAMEKIQKAMGHLGKVAQATSIAGDVVESVESIQADNAALSAALAQNAAMMAAQMAADMVAAALQQLIGKDQPILPPSGTPGSIISLASPNVVIGGFPMVSTMDLAKGLLKAVNGLRKRRKKPPLYIPGVNTREKCGC